MSEIVEVELGLEIVDVELPSEILSHIQIVHVELGVDQLVQCHPLVPKLWMWYK